MATTKETPGRNRANNTAITVSVSDLFFMTLRHWPWVLLSVFISVSIAYVYLLRTPDVFSRSTEIQIKNDSQGQSVTGEELAKMGLIQSNTNIENEMANLKAKDLMEEVVRRLGLDINYYQDGRFHDVVAYGENRPVKLLLDGCPDEDSFSMELSVSGDGKVTFRDLKKIGSDADGQTFSGRIGGTIVTPMGRMTVIPTSSYTKGQSVTLSVEKIPLGAARDSYNSRLVVETSNAKGSMLKLTIADQSTQRADDVLNTLITVYNENWIRDKNQVAVATSNFINDRLRVIEDELGVVDSDISSYKSANLVPNVDAAASMYMGQAQQLQKQILELNNQLSMARYVRSYLTVDGSGQLLPANTGLKGSNIESLIGEYNTGLLRRNALVASSSEKNPLVVQLDEQLAAQRLSIIRSIDNEITALNTQLKSLRGSESQTLSNIASNPTQAKNLLSTERKQKVKESLYLFLLQKREESELSQAFTAYNTRIVNKPGASGLPSTPNRRNILAMALLIGLVLPVSVVFIREINNTKIRGRKDVEHLIVPFLGEIPQYMPATTRRGEKAERLTGNTIIVREGKRDIINEAFRVLRTNVDFMCGADPGAKVIALTSFNPGSGKSFISINLGMTVALKGKNVLVIDGDMRHRSTSTYVGSPSTGLSAYLCGAEDDIERLLVKDATCDTLSILPVGQMPPNPTELLESPRLGELLAVVKERFDYIIIDCPPIEVVADAQIIDRYVDRTFFVIRAGLFEKAMLPEIDRLYGEKKYRNMAFILNGTNNNRGRYGYGAYRYGYGYGYGYDYESSRRKK